MEGGGYAINNDLLQLQAVTSNTMEQLLNDHDTIKVNVRVDESGNDKSSGTITVVATAATRTATPRAVTTNTGMTRVKGEMKIVQKSSSNPDVKLIF